MFYTRTAIEPRGSDLLPSIARSDVRQVSNDERARHAAERTLDQILADSFPASDPPAPPPSAVAAVARGRLRRQEGRIGWIFLWLIGVPVPILLLLYFLRGCT